MRKWSVLTLVILGGLLLALKYFSDKGIRQAPPSSAPGQGQPTGVPLPPSAASSPVPQTMDPISAGTGSYDSLVLPTEPAPYTGACQGGSLNEMLATHGKYWGYFAKKPPFTAAETNRLYEFSANYAACIAVARDDLSLCDTLPAEAEQNGVKVGENENSLKYKCGQLAVPILFRAYVAGKVQNDDYCIATLPKFKDSTIPTRDLCKIIRKGVESTRDIVIGRNPKEAGNSEKKSKILKFLATSEAACGGNAACIHNFRLYTAIKNEKASACPRTADRGLCEAMASRSEKPCGAIIRDMSKFYCAAVSRVKKATGGFIGMSPEEIRAYFEQKKLRETEEARQKAENDKIIAVNNKNLRKMLGKD